MSISLTPDAPLPSSGCCGVTDAAVAVTNLRARQSPDLPPQPEVGDMTAYVRTGRGNTNTINLMVEGITCGGCISRIERCLNAFPAVIQARVNMTTRRLVLSWTGEAHQVSGLAGAITRLGYRVIPYDPDRLEDSDRREERRLLTAMGIAGFGAANVMLLSVSVWAGHAHGMGEATRTLLHWFSALVALPCVVLALKPFYTSAWQALRRGRTNMDVPITLGVMLAAGASLLETIDGGDHAYFDSAVTLLFFLLVGRFLDRRARGKARAAAQRLLSLQSIGVTIRHDDGTTSILPPEHVRDGMTMLVAPGERIGADGTVTIGTSDVDQSVITGETVPVAVSPGSRLFAGTLNQTGSLTLSVTAAGERTLLNEIVRLMESAEQRKAMYVALADRVSRLYAPVVHLLSLATFLVWWGFIGSEWQSALMIAVSVLIITCPCALGLAVPAVQVIASGRLLRDGTLLKSATALERLATVDTVVFDKTGTLTLGRPVLRDAGQYDLETLCAAAAVAGKSRHPLAQAVAAAAPASCIVDPDLTVTEVPGFGLVAASDAGEVRLGSARWCGVDEPPTHDPGRPVIWLTRPNHDPVRFVFDDTPRADAANTVTALQRLGIQVELLSGDTVGSVETTAHALGISRWRAQATPDRKAAYLADLAAEGRTVLMVGDGINDGPALAAAHVSASPASATDIAQTAADAVFQGEKLSPVLDLIHTARRSQRLVRQNFGLAIAYNIVTIPLAVLGMVTPLIAAVAMSGSSIAVVTNALRLARRGPESQWTRSSS